VSGKRCFRLPEEIKRDFHGELREKRTDNQHAVLAGSGPNDDGEVIDRYTGVNGYAS
jgi:hypothetical protein